MKGKEVIFGILIILFINFISAVPYILFVNPTPVNSYSTESTSFEINSTLNEIESLNGLIWNWDSVNYSLYDEDLVLMYNFENNSLLGEDDSIIIDLSKHGNNGSVTNNSLSTANGKHGRAHSFIFENQSINITDSAVLHSSNMTISFWVNLTTSKTKQLAANSWSSYILLENGDVYAWGYNGQGQLGDNTTINKNIPVKVVGNFKFSSLAYSGYPGENNGAGHMCGILTNGSAMCWGYNANGRLGDNATTNRYRPIFVYGNYNFSKIYTGRHSSCGLLFNGSALCWGRTVYGALGDNTTTDENKLIPTAVFGNYNFSYLTMGDTMACGIQQNGSALCWGRNEGGAVGDNTTENKYVPTPVFGNNNFSKIFAGNEKTCGLLQNGTLLCWGLQGSAGGDAFICGGGLGTNSCDDSTIPIPVYGNNLKFKNIEAHYFGFCGILTNGSAMCWGNGEYGNNGDGTEEDRLAPVFVSENSNFSQISGGYAHMLALTTNGTLFSWGRNSQNELGKGVNLNIIPLPVVFQYGNSSDYSYISYSTTPCFILHNGSAMCWGYNLNGKVGDNTTEDKDVPVFISGDYNFSQISGEGYGYSCGLLQNGSALCWGLNSYGQLGNGTTGGESSIPVYVAGEYNFSSIHLGSYHNCGLLYNKSALCWGRNTQGQLGNGTTGGQSNIPIYVSGEYDFNSLIVGGYHNCGLLQNGSGFCWGQNTYGQLGNGSLGNGNIPKIVSGEYNFSSIHLGNTHSCGLLHNGSALCWGRNLQGQLGNGSIGGQSSVPVYVSGGYNFSALFARGITSCGLLHNGSALCWGYNNQGQLGDGTTSSSAIPLFVKSGEYNFSSIEFSFGVLTDGRIVTWGDNQYGQQALAPVFDKKIPTSGFYKGNFFGKNPTSFEILSTFDNQARIFFRGFISDINLNNQYTQITLVVNENNAYTYKNGNLVDSLSPEVLSYYDDPSSLIIGNNSFGEIDELRVYNRSLSASEIEQLYRTNLKKVNSTSWEFYANESINDDKTYNYGLFSLDGSTSFNLLRNIIKYTRVSTQESSSPGRRNPVVTTIVSNEQIENGYERAFRVNNQIRFEFNNGNIIARIDSINSNSVIVNVDGINYSVNINETKKIDIDEDGYYDLQISVSLVSNLKTSADLEFQLIHEKISSEEQEEFIEEVEEDINNYIPEEDKKNNWIYFVIGGIIILGLIVFFTHKKVKKKKRYRMFGY